LLHVIDPAPSVREFGGIRFDTTDWPIFVIEFPPHRPTDEGFRGAFAALEVAAKQALARNELAFVLTDLTRMRETPTASQRQDAAAFMKRAEDLLRVATIGGSHITPSAILRGLITAVYWIQPTPRPSACFATRAEAIAYGIQLYQKANVPVPQALLSYGRAERKAR
jgi:hypothetical protein